MNTIVVNKLIEFLSKIMILDAKTYFYKYLYIYYKKLLKKIKIRNIIIVFKNNTFPK